MKNHMVTVKSYSDIIEAQLAKGKLIASGIDAFVEKDDCAHLYPAMNFSHGVHLKVVQNDLEDAKKLLGISSRENVKLRFDLQQNINALYSLLILVLNGIGFGLFVAADTNILKITGIIFLLFGIGIWVMRRILHNKSM